MRQELQTWRSEAGSRLWLSALIAAMEDASRQDKRCVDPSALDGLRAQLGLSVPLGRRYLAPVSWLRH